MGTLMSCKSYETEVATAVVVAAEATAGSEAGAESIASSSTFGTVEFVRRCENRKQAKLMWNPGRSAI